ncbi:MAG: hypothetical protein IH899_18255 [Planctomycetes bacterium]|nr:hypothetical protein [Planctomycetota bacterium]
MDDGRKSTVRTAVALSMAVIICCLTGCSLVVMTGKMLFGNPKRQCAFSIARRVNLVKEKKKVLVICSVPESIKLEFSSLEIDLQDSVTRQLKRQEILVVNPNKVIDWIQDNGSGPSDPSQLARELAASFKTDYIVIIDLERFSYKEENSPTLYQGHAEGNVLAFEVNERDGTKSALNVFSHEFQSVYPRFSPKSAHEISKQTFVNDYLRRVSLELAQLFYDHPLSEEVQ